MKAIVWILGAAVVGLGLQNYRLAQRLDAMTGKADAVEGVVYPRPSEADDEVRKLRYAIEADGRRAERERQAQREEMDSLSNALSDKGIIWHPNP